MLRLQSWMGVYYLAKYDYGSSDNDKGEDE
jgi:hypothetical protein